jgi:26S proteasome regulatory subunit N11
MLRHGRAGVPMEVMGLMLGEFVDDYTVRVVDVFAMPQSGTGVSVEAVDPVFQTKMMEMLRQTGRCVNPTISTTVTKDRPIKDKRS